MKVYEVVALLKNLPQTAEIVVQQGIDGESNLQTSPVEEVGFYEEGFDQVVIFFPANLSGLTDPFKN